MLTSTTIRSGTNTLSSRTLLEPEACMPMNRPSPQSGRTVRVSRGMQKKTCLGGPPGCGARLPPMKWVETVIPEQNGKTPSTM